MKNKVRRFLAGSVLLGTFLTAGTTFAATPKANDRMKMRAPSYIGTVSTIDGNTLTIFSKMRNSSTTKKTYTVDATNAKIIKEGTSTVISNIAIGDVVVVKGKVNGTIITAKSIRDEVILKNKLSKKEKKKLSLKI